MDSLICDSIVQNILGIADDAIRKVILAEVEEVVLALTGTTAPSGVERTLIHAAATNWLFLKAMEYHQANLANQVSGPSGRAEFIERRVDRAHRRLMSALKTLATVRRLALPALQVNIGGQQVNLASAANLPEKAKPRRAILGED